MGRTTVHKARKLTLRDSRAGCSAAEDLGWDAELGRSGQPETGSAGDPQQELEAVVRGHALDVPAGTDSGARRSMRPGRLCRPVRVVVRVDEVGGDEGPRVRQVERGGVEALDPKQVDELDPVALELERVADELVGRRSTVGISPE